MPTESAMPSSHLSLCYLFLPLPSILLSIQVFSNESGFPIRWPKHWSFCFGISPSNEHSGLISFRIDWFALLVVQGTQVFSSILKSPHFKSINSSVLILLYGPTLTSVRDQWKNHNFDYTYRCRRNLHSSCWPLKVPGAWTCGLEFSWCFLFSTECGHGCQGVLSELHRDCASDS